MRILIALLSLAALIIAQTAPNVTGLSPAAQQAMNGIDAEKIRATVKEISDDKYQGRGTGQKGGDMAADWLAQRFQSYHLEPAGEHGSFFQNVRFYGIATDQQKTQLSFATTNTDRSPWPLKFADDYIVLDETHSPQSAIDAPLVYVGYGISAPEYQWDDYKGADLKGKVLLMLVNEPPSDDPNFFKGKALTYYGRWTYKYEEAARRGAIGALLIHKTEMASYGWEVVRNSWGGEKSFLADEQGPKLHAAGWIQLAVAQKLAQLSGKNLEQMMQDATSRNFTPVEMPIRLKGTIASSVRTFASRNVVAKLTGADPQLRNQAVLYSAHYDHLGIHANEPGDNIYNGAADNATGCGILLEMARAFATSKEKPKRSILFAAVTAEEQNLLGSRYLGEHPPLPARNISLDLNYDDVQPWGDPLQVEVSGAERTTVFPVVQQVAQQFGLQIVPDSNPGAGYYYRSDHFSLARVGVPAFSVNEGLLYRGHELQWGEAKEEDYRAHRYHQPKDEYTPDMDFTGDAKVARFGFAIGWQVANAAGLSGWQPGDEFERARKQSQQ
jgi:Zn-dependent M28 family amino/carboxypeptidase